MLSDNLETSFAPWTPEQVDNLNGYQQCPCFHHYTCRNCPKVLVAHADGWRCECGYRQNTAAPFMVSGAWRGTLEEYKRLGIEI